MGTQVKTASQTFEFHMNSFKIGFFRFVKKIRSWGVTNALKQVKLETIKKIFFIKTLVFYRRFFSKNLPKILMLLDERKLLLKEYFGKILLVFNPHCFHHFHCFFNFSNICQLLLVILVPRPKTSQPFSNYINKISNWELWLDQLFSHVYYKKAVLKKFAFHRKTSVMGHCLIKFQV